MSAKKKYYVVWQGKAPGIYDNWEDCKAQVDGFEKARYKSYPTKDEAETAYKSDSGKAIFAKPSTASRPPSTVSRSPSAIVWESLSVDAACSGNPGLMEYQGVETQSKKLIFHQKFALGTNNVGEFLAIVHALAMFEKQGKATAIYTDSKTAMAWVRNKKCKSALVRNKKTENLWQLVERAENWLQTHTWKNPIMKWETEVWGEIPADFGRK